MRPALLALAAVLTVSACAGGPAPGPEFVYSATGAGITVADGTGTVLSSGATVASDDWRRLYAVRGSTLRTTDPANRELARASVPPGLVARVVSTSHARVALTTGNDPLRPTPRARTRIVVADPSGATPVRELDLAGNLEPEAFSADDSHLFVLEYLPPLAPERYRVRRVQLATGQVHPLLSRDKALVPAGAEEEMRGEGRQAVLAPDRSRLYTLYLHHGEHEHTRDLLGTGATGPDVHAFVHVLSLTEGWAYCLDLPAPFGERPAEPHALALSPDGATLYVAEPTTIATADTAALTVTGVSAVADGDATGAGAAMVATRDGLYLGGGRVMRRIDAATLRVTHTWRTPAPIRGVAPRGGEVLVGQPGRVARLDARTGAVVGTVPAAGLLTLHTGLVH